MPVNVVASASARVVSAREVIKRASGAGIEVSVGRRGTVLLCFDGAVVALVQPESNDKEHWGQRVHVAKQDVVDVLGDRHQTGQGIIYLPSNALIQRSPEGAAEMGLRSLTYEVEVGPGDRIDNVLGFIDRWRRRSTAGAAYIDLFEQDLEEGF